MHWVTWNNKNSSDDISMMLTIASWHLTEEYISWLAQVITTPDTPDSHTKMTAKIVTMRMTIAVTVMMVMMIMMITLSSGEGEHKHSGEVNRPLSATCQPKYNHSWCSKSRHDDHCDDDDDDVVDDYVGVSRTSKTAEEYKLWLLMTATAVILFKAEVGHYWFFLVLFGSFWFFLGLFGSFWFFFVLF